MSQSDKVDDDDLRIEAPHESLTRDQLAWLDLRRRLLQSIIECDAVPPGEILVADRGVSPLRAGYPYWEMLRSFKIH